MPIKRTGRRQRGFGLPEALFAALLFAVTLLGLLHYHQVLLQAFQRQWHYRHAWWLAHQQLSLFNAGADRPFLILTLPPNWRSEIETHKVENRENTSMPALCLRRTVKIETPLRQQVVLSRWYCRQ